MKTRHMKTDLREINPREMPARALELWKLLATSGTRTVPAEARRWRRRLRRLRHRNCRLMAGRQLSTTAQLGLLRASTHPGAAGARLVPAPVQA
jgi:hypothetical protein